jgi:hypothetical protein
MSSLVSNVSMTLSSVTVKLPCSMVWAEGVGKG